MEYEFKLPDIGEGVVEGEIVRWLVGEGESIVEDQPIVEVQIDKENESLEPLKSFILPGGDPAARRGRNRDHQTQAREPEIRRGGRAGRAQAQGFR